MERCGYAALCVDHYKDEGIYTFADRFRLCDEVNTMLRYVWQTANANTCAIPGTGTAAWDAAISNLIGPGEVVVCFCNGKFSDKSA